MILKYCGVTFTHPFIFTSIRKTLFFLAAATSSFTCLEFMAKGFSHSTFFPASRNSRPTFQCSVCSTPTYTMSVGGGHSQLKCFKRPRAGGGDAPFVLTDVPVAGQLRVAAVSRGNAVRLGKGLGPLQAPGRDGGYLREGVGGGVGDTAHVRPLTPPRRRRVYLSTW